MKTFDELHMGLAAALRLSTTVPADEMVARVARLLEVAAVQMAELQEARAALLTQQVAAKMGYANDTPAQEPAAPADLLAPPTAVHNLKTGDVVIARGTAEHFQAYHAQYRALMDMMLRLREQGTFIEVLVLRHDIPIEVLSEEQMAKAGWVRSPGWLDMQKDMATEPPSDGRFTKLEIT